MDDDDLTVPGKLNVEFDPVGAQFRGKEKGCQRIIRRFVAGAPVREVQGSVTIQRIPPNARVCCVRCGSVASVLGNSLSRPADQLPRLPDNEQWHGVKD